jgi:CubicO group peptidase (beta-lactamase class C family)
MLRPLLFVLILAPLLVGCITEPALKHPHDTHPAELGDGWAVAAPADVGLNPDAVAAVYRRFFSEREFYNAQSLLIVRDGRLVAEGYARELGDRSRIHHVQSITKSVTSLVFGILHDDGVFADVDEPLGTVLPDSSFGSRPQAREITLHHLLTMSSGLELDNHRFAVDLLMRRPRNQARYLLSRPFYAAPGERFRYRDADPQLLSYAIQARTGRTLEDHAVERLFRPLGIVDYHWEKNADGVTLGAHGLWLRPRDLAKIGQLVLDQGIRNGQQVVSAEWVSRSTRPQIEIGQDDPVTSGFSYGYYWWIVPELEAFSAWGHGGQYVFVVPGARLVVVLTARPDSDNRNVGSELKDFLPLVRTILAG